MSVSVTHAPQTLLSAATTGNGGLLMLRGESLPVTIVIQGNGTTTGGTVLIEEAFWPEDQEVYAGTWSLLATVDPNDVSGGKQKAYHFSPNSYWAIRTRISSAITGGGSVSSYGWAVS